jgi:hypothetical protein
MPPCVLISSPSRFMLGHFRATQQPFMKSPEVSAQDSCHIPDKIPQQLLILRDLNLLEFLGAGSYRLR